MRDEDKTKEQLINELIELRKKANYLGSNKETYFLASKTPKPSTHPLSSTSRILSFAPTKGFRKIAKKPIKYHISELIDISFLKQFLASLYKIFGIPYALADGDSNFLIDSGWLDICTKFHRACPETACRCMRSDLFIKEHLQEVPYIGYKCLNGLVDYATPIVIEGKHLATIFLGQILHEPPDEEFFRRQAKEFGFDERTYFEALQQVSIIPESRAKDIMNFICHLAQILSIKGLERVRHIETVNSIIKEQEQRLSLVLEASTDGFWDWNITTGEIYNSRRWFEILGYSIEEIGLKYHSWHKLIHPDDINTALQLLNKHLHEKTPYYMCECRFLTKSGVWKWILVQGRVVARNEQGRALRMAGTCSDITKRKEMEEALRSSEERFSKAFNFNPLIMTIVSFEDNRFIDVNEAFCRVTGFLREEVVGRTMTELNIFHPITEHTVQLSKIPQEDNKDYIEVSFYSKSGDKRIGLLVTEFLVIGGETCMLNVIRDITEHRQMEIEMVRLDRLHLVGEMAAGIGHEIRNPMTSVRGFLQMFEYKFVEDKEFLDLMLEELDRANAIISEYLSLARNKIMQLEPLNLNDMIKKFLPMVQAKAMIKDQSIQLETDELPELQLDQKEIRQLFLNLVENGLESMAPGGILRLKTTLEEEYVVLAVQDQGNGIDANIKDKLGTPFFTTKEFGTGLGLAVCYGIADRHKAKIDYATSPKGTTFYVRFPI